MQQPARGANGRAQWRQQYAHHQLPWPMWYHWPDIPSAMASGQMSHASPPANIHPSIYASIGRCIPEISEMLAGLYPAPHRLCPIPVKLLPNPTAPVQPRQHWQLPPANLSCPAPWPCPAVADENILPLPRPCAAGKGPPPNHLQSPMVPDQNPSGC